MAGSVSSGVAQTREARAGRGSRRPTLDDFERLAWPAFGAAASVAALIILWLGSGVGYSLDEIDTLIRTPGLDFDGTLEPHNGHFIFTTRVAYWAILELFGTDYLAFRLLTVATVVLTAALFLAYAGRRIGKLSALALALLLLFFGSHPSHVMNGNGFTVLFAIACGLAALLLLERNDRGGDIGACALLCLGVATYTTGLPFVAGAAVAILLRDDRWRRIWVVAVPVAIYFAWWLQAEGQIGDPQDQATVSNLLLLPAWGFQILSGVLGSVSGFDYFGELASAGPALAVAALGVLAWRLARGRLPDSFWIALAVVLAIWALGALAAGIFRLPDDSRYFFSTLIGALLVGVTAAAGARWSRTSIIVLYAAVAAALSTNLLMLRDGGDDLSALQLPTRSALAGVDAAGDLADPDLDIKAATEGAPLGTPVRNPVAARRDRGRVLSPGRRQLRAARVLARGAERTRRGRAGGGRRGARRGARDRRQTGRAAEIKRRVLDARRRSGPAHGGRDRGRRGRGDRGRKRACRRLSAALRRLDRDTDRDGPAGPGRRPAPARRPAF